jgi:hypothetical protein
MGHLLKRKTPDGKRQGKKSAGALPIAGLRAALLAERLG